MNKLLATALRVESGRFGRTSAFAGMFAAGLATAAGAQTAPGVTAAADPDAEIVVTARKRNESLIDVPAAITAISATDRQNLVLDGFRDYIRQVPGATLVSSGPEYLQDITIRGQGAGRLGFSETATGLFRDGLYNAGGGFGGRAPTRLDFFDSSQIEVLRGPQGALYGRNSVGGAIDITTQKPVDNFEGYVTGRYVRPDRVAVEGVVNIPLVSDKLALRIAGLYDDQRGGFILNNTTGNFLDTQRFAGGRAALRWTPDALTTIDLSYEHYDSRTPAFGGLARRSVRIDGTALDPSPFERTDTDREGAAKINEDAVYFAARRDVGFASLNVRASYKTREAGRSGEDNDHFAGHSSIDVAPGAAVLTPDYSIGQFENYDRVVAQAYLSSNTGSRFDWLIGVEYLSSDGDVVVDPNFCPAYTGAVQPNTPGCFVGLSGALTGFGATARNGGRVGLNNDSFNDALRSPSIFGSLEFKLAERTSLGLEARVQQDRRSVTATRFSEDPLVFFGTGAIPAGLSAPISSDPDGAGPLPAAPIQFCPPGLVGCAPGLEANVVTGKQKRTYFTPTATLRQQIGDSGNVYLRLSTGYRPGGVNSNQPPTTVRSQFQGFLLYDSEYAYSAEIGAKGRIAGIAVSAAVFYMRTNDVQVVSAPSSLSRGFILQNAGDAYVYGYEIEARKRWRFGDDGSFDVTAAISGQDGAYMKGATALIDLNGDGLPEQASLAGNQIPRLRDYQLSLNAVLTVPVTTNLKGFVSGSFQTASGGFDNPQNSREFAGYSLFDARVGIRTERLTASVYVRNIGNQIYVTNMLNGNDFYNEPRVIGAEVSVRF